MIELRVDEDALLRRIETRVAEMKARGEKLRDDDNPEVLHKRLEAYRQLTAPLIAYYRQHGILRSVNGMAPIDDVTAAIDQVLATASSEQPAGRSAAKKKSSAPKAAARPGAANRPERGKASPGNRGRSKESIGKESKKTTSKNTAAARKKAVSRKIRGGQIRGQSRGAGKKPGKPGAANRVPTRIR